MKNARHQCVSNPKKSEFDLRGGSELNCKKMFCRRYLQNKWRNMVKEVQIFLATAHYFAIFSSKNDREIEPFHFAYHKPSEFNKMGDDFLCIFHFSLTGFS